MTTLAVDLSSEIGSLAMMDRGRMVFEKEWQGEARQRRPIFADLHALVKAGTLDWPRVDRLAVGVGPGAFSGLRMAVSLFRGLAIPDNKPVVAVSSARALAWAVLKETGTARVVVFGDARRNELWAGCFGWEDGIVRLAGDWVVTVAEQIPDNLKTSGSVWVTPDWNRIGTILEGQCPASVTLVGESRLPRASMVAHIAEDLGLRGLEGEPLVPIYVHPAVSIAPRY